VSTVHLGLLRIVLHLPESGSLKSKRRVVSSLVRRLRSEFGVAAAEVGELDRWQLAELAVACLSADARHASSILATAAGYIETHAGDAVVTSITTELIVV
jgi:uncharacterized protein YlxP (DUF503 family)